jgi:hypothetical protein
MPLAYRKAIGSAVWHFSTGCSTWPTSNYIEAESPQQSQDGEICSDCTVHQQSLRIRKCPVIVDNKKCGLDLTTEMNGFFQCALGHRTSLMHSQLS